MRSAFSLLLVFCLVVETFPGRVLAQPPQQQQQPQQPQASQAQPQQGTMVPVPPQGVQVVVVDTPPQGDARRQWLELRLRELQVARSQYRVGGPIALMITGGILMLFTGLIALGFRAADRADTDDSGGVIINDYGRVARGFGIAALFGAAFLITGAALLPRRLRQRRQYDPEIRQIRQELRMYQQAPRYGFAPTISRTGGGLAFGLSF